MAKLFLLSFLCLLPACVFGQAGNATPGSVTITPAGPNAATLTGTSAVYEDQASRAAGSFTLKVGAGGLQAATTYVFSYRVTG